MTSLHCRVLTYRVGLLYACGMDETVIAEAKQEILKRLALKGFCRLSDELDDESVSDYTFRVLAELVHDGLLRDGLDEDGEQIFRIATRYDA